MQLALGPHWHCAPHAHCAPQAHCGPQAQGVGAADGWQPQRQPVPGQAVQVQVQEIC